MNNMESVDKLREKLVSKEGYTLQQHLFEDDYNKYVKDWEVKYNNWWRKLSGKLSGKKMLSYEGYINYLWDCNRRDNTLTVLFSYCNNTMVYDEVDKHRQLTNKYSQRFVEYVDTLNQIKEDKYDSVYSSLTRPYKDMIDRFLDENVEWVESFPVTYIPHTSTVYLEDRELGLVFTISKVRSKFGEVCVAKKYTPENKLRLDIDTEYLNQVVEVCRDNINNNYNKNELIKSKQLEQELIEVHDSLMEEE